jgi:hypothetical protein
MGTKAEATDTDAVTKGTPSGMDVVELDEARGRPHDRSRARPPRPTDAPEARDDARPRRPKPIRPKPEDATDAADEDDGDDEGDDRRR